MFPFWSHLLIVYAFIKDFGIVFVCSDKVTLDSNSNMIFAYLCITVQQKSLQNMNKLFGICPGFIENRIAIICRSFDRL